MKLYTAVIEVATSSPEELVDLTAAARAEVARSGVENGVCALYAHGATAALMVQENADPSIALDVIDCLARLVPAGHWRHDRVDDNGAAHLKAGIIGPSETIPIRSGDLALSTWQNIFLCDFDGPRRTRRVLVTITGE
jgi:secondary thiamine-phosphate synthase enzyme